MEVFPWRSVSQWVPIVALVGDLVMWRRHHDHGMAISPMRGQDRALRCHWVNPNCQPQNSPCRQEVGCAQRVAGKLVEGWG